MPVNGSGAQILEFVDRQSWLGQEVINRYWYRIDNLSEPDLATAHVAFENGVIGPIVNFQNEGLVHVDLTIINHSNPASFGLFTTDINGVLVSSDNLPPFAALGVRLLRTSRELRNGHKRIAGMQENGQIDGIWTSSFLTVVSTNAGAFTQNLIESIRTYVPVIVRNRPTLNDLSIDPNDATTWKYVTIGGVAIKNAVTTQNSRKF
jgi:hypothetical protein